MVSSKSRPIYFLMNIDGLSLFDVKFSSFAPSTDSALLGGLVHAISTFSETVIMDGSIRSESGKLNVIEQQGRKIMFERGIAVEAILVVDVESIILMEKLRTIIDLFEENYLESIQKNGIITTYQYKDFQELTRKFLTRNVEENVIFKLKSSKTTQSSSMSIPLKWNSLIQSFNGMKSLIEISRQKRWPIEYIMTRSSLLQQLDFLTAVDISIKDTDIFRIEDSYIGILLGQGTAYQMIQNTWGNWGIKITSHIDGKHTVKAFSTRYLFSTEDKKRMIHLFRWLSLHGYITLISDDELLIIILKEFMDRLRDRCSNFLGEAVSFNLFETIIIKDINNAEQQNKIISISKLVENDRNGFHYEKLQTVMRSRAKIIKPLIQQAFLPFLDCTLEILAKVIGNKAAAETHQLSIIDTEKKYGNLVYDILNLS